MYMLNYTVVFVGIYGLDLASGESGPWFAHQPEVTHAEWVGGGDEVSLADGTRVPLVYPGDAVGS